MPRLRLALAYEGTRYAGWQLQAPKSEKYHPTVQGILENAVSGIIGRRVPVHGAGRTDSGVHADGQICHLDLPETSRCIDWLKALNVKLPEDIRITGADWVTESFHARKSARGKRYAYSLWMDAAKAAPKIQAFVWSGPRLDMERLTPAIPYLVGRHDFASFRNNGTPLADTVREIFSVRCCPGMAAGLACPGAWPVATLIFEGDGFLKQMVRNLVGLLVWVALGKINCEAIPAIMAAKERRALPSPTAPARGLTLLEVLY